ncbi:MAG TPA: PAS domain S-box protein [Planctomycetota bacterium]|nr:PAS domain S-box protein [Planctomycetota bacterium]
MMRDARAPLRILSLEDDLEDALLVERALRASGIRFVFRRVEGREEFLRALAEEEPPDLILSDHSVPSLTGLEALTLARERRPGIPFIFVSGHVGEQRAVEALRAGATDYILKDNLTALGASVRRAVREADLRRDFERAQAELRERAEALRLILDSALDAVVTMDEEGRVTGWNPQAERIFGWSREEALGRPMADLIVPERYREVHRTGLARFLATGQGPILRRRIEIEALRRSGEEFTVELAVIPVQVGGRWSFSAFVRDITDRKRRATRADLDRVVSRILAASPRPEEAVRAILQALCRELGWPVALYWRVDPEAGVLRLGDAWPEPAGAFAEFLEDSRRREFRRGEVLPGRIWEQEAPHWFERIREDPAFRRASFAARAGLAGGFGFPVGEPGRLRGVIEVFSRRPEPPDPEMLEMTADLGRAIGRFLERRDAEERLRESQERFRVLSEEVPEILFMARPDGLWEYVNGRFLAHTGMAPEAASGEGWIGILHPDDRDAVRERWRRSVAAGEPFEAEFRLRRADGAYRWFLARSVPLRDGEGRVSRWLGVATDIDDQRRARDRQAFLTEASATLASSLEVETTLATVSRLVVPRFGDWCAVHLLQENGTVRHMGLYHRDPARVRLVEEMLALYPLDPDLPHGYPKVLRTGEPELIPELTPEIVRDAVRSEEHRRRIESLALVSSLCVPLRARGRTIGALSVATAESGRRLGQAELELMQELGRLAAYAIDNARLYREVRELTSTLEERVARRTAELEEALLQMEAFTYSVSHDLRAPIRAIGSYADILLAEKAERLDEDGRASLRRIAAAARHMDALTRDLLVLARVGRTHLEVRTIDPTSLLREILAGMQEEIAACGAQVALEEPFPPVRGDRLLLGQALQNYLSNAIKFVAPGVPPRVRVRAERRDGRVRLWVEDNGIGIAREYWDRLFRLFERLHTAQEYPGTGVGLAIVQKAADRMGGRVGVESEPGKGSRFWIELPAA